MGGSTVLCGLLAWRMGHPGGRNAILGLVLVLNFMSGSLMVAAHGSSTMELDKGMLRAPPASTKTDTMLKKAARSAAKQGKEAGAAAAKKGATKTQKKTAAAVKKDMK